MPFGLSIAFRMAKEPEWYKQFITNCIRPETKWSSHEQIEVCLKWPWRIERTSVAKDGDDLWLGVKGLSNLVIAGLPRNIFKYNFLIDCCGVENSLCTSWVSLGIKLIETTNTYTTVREVSRWVRRFNDKRATAQIDV